jgi:hypothetical protein
MSGVMDGEVYYNALNLFFLKLGSSGTGFQGLIAIPVEPFILNNKKEVDTADPITCA